MSFWDIFKKREVRQSEDSFIVTITDASVKVEHPEWPVREVFWNDIHEIKLINTDEGPWLPDIWMALIDDNKKVCLIPHGNKGFDQVFEIISKYEGFNMENFGKSMTYSDNAEFVLWVKKQG